MRAAALPPKIIIFSNWLQPLYSVSVERISCIPFLYQVLTHSLLPQLGAALLGMAVRCDRVLEVKEMAWFTGNEIIRVREESIFQLNSPTSEVKVVMCTYRAACVGINLVRWCS